MICQECNNPLKCRRCGTEPTDTDIGKHLGRKGGRPEGIPLSDDHKAARDAGLALRRQRDREKREALAADV